MTREELSAGRCRTDECTAAADQGRGFLSTSQSHPLKGASTPLLATDYRSGALDHLITSSAVLFRDAPTLVALALEAGLPTVREWREMAEQGCMMGYGPDITELRRRTADYVVCIFWGASPSELPIEGPTCSDQSAPERGDAAEFRAAMLAGTRTPEKAQISPTAYPRLSAQD